VGEQLGGYLWGRILAPAGCMAAMSPVRVVPAGLGRVGGSLSRGEGQLFSLELGTGLPDLLS
jgi:hypothetical protein